MRFYLRRSAEKPLQSDIIFCYGGNRNSSGTTVIRSSKMRNSMTGKGKANLFSNVRTYSEAKKSPIQWAPDSFTGLKRSWREADYLYPSSADIKNLWRYKCTSHVCLYGVYRDASTFPTLRLIN